MKSMGAHLLAAALYIVSSWFMLYKLKPQAGATSITYILLIMLVQLFMFTIVYIKQSSTSLAAEGSPKYLMVIAGMIDILVLGTMLFMFRMIRNKVVERGSDKVLFGLLGTQRDFGIYLAGITGAMALVNNFSIV